MEQNPKYWWQSKAVWGGIVAVVAGIAGASGQAIDPEAQTTLTDLAVSGAVVFGGILSIVGRIFARGKIVKNKATVPNEENMEIS